MQIFPSIIADHGAQVSIGNTYVSNHTRVRSSRHGPSVGEMDLGLRAAEQTARQAEVLGRQFDADMQQLGSHMEELFGSVGAGDSRNGNPSRASSDMRSRPSSPQSDKSGSCFSLFRCGRPRTKSRNRPSRTPTPSDASGRYGYQLSTHVFGNQGIEQDGESPHIRLDPLVTPLPVHLRDTPHHTSGRNGCSSASEAEHHDPSDPPPPYTDDRSNTETPSRRRGRANHSASDSAPGEHHFSQTFRGFRSSNGGSIVAGTGWGGGVVVQNGVWTEGGEVVRPGTARIRYTGPRRGH